MEYPLCPACNGQAEYMGKLGRLLWFRCFFCGAEFNIDTEEHPEYLEEDEDE